MIDLHVHTKYSLLDSMIEPIELIEKLKQLNRRALCVTEHGNLYSSIELFKLCEENNIKYLHGCEMYICEDVKMKSKDSKYNHLILISKNEIGRLNLVKLVSESNNYKYYGKPRIDFEMLRKYSEGLIAISACMVGEIQRSLYNNDINQAECIAYKYKNLFNDDYYLEYQSHADLVQQDLNRKVVDLANKLNIKYIVSTDAHYINKEDQKYHSIFVQIGQSREVGETYSDCYIQTEEEILRICKSTTKEENLIAMENTHEIVEKCNVEIPLSAPIMPHINIPQRFKDEIDYLKYLSVEGFKKRKIHLLDKEVQREYIERLKYELKIIKEMGFEGYYLLVWSYANSVKRRGIARGSGGGSLVAYLINIVDTDPVKYGLYFERFIDVGALDLLKKGIITKSQLKIPDFDLDFGKEDRDKVMNYITDTYGKNRVASLGSFQYIWAKGAIKDIGKVLGIPFEITNKMTSKLNLETIQEALDFGLLDEYKEHYPELFTYALKLAGLPKSFSMHPCGKVITMQDVIYYNAIDISDDGEHILQGDMHTAEDLGLIKIDVLGLRTIDVIYDTLEMIGKDYDYIAPHNIDFNDRQVLENFRKGNTLGIFQFESSGMRKTLENIECNSLYDLSVANALYRPGSMDYIQNYANRRKGVEQYQFLHEDLRSILKDSYAIIVFQEQLIEIGRMAYLSNPDELRQATAKKKDKLMAKIKPELFDGLGKRGWEEEQLNELWDIMLKFAKYSFNKSHSVAYAIIAYICMYLKTYHPKEFITAWINSYKGKTDKLSPCIEEARRLSLEVGCSNWRNVKGLCRVEGDKIVVGTQSIKYLNIHIADELHNLSNNTYNSFIELLKDINEKTSANTKQIEILITLNYFSEFGKNKKLLNIYDMFENLSTRKQITKKQIEKLNINEELLKKYSNKTTEKLYKELNMIGYINEISNRLEDKSLNIKDQISAEKEYLGYESTKLDKVPSNVYIITEIDDKYTPKLRMYNLNSGKVEILKCKKNDIKKNPFGEYSVIKMKETTKRNKNKLVNDEWIQTDEQETYLTKWEIIM